MLALCALAQCFFKVVSQRVSLCLFANERSAGVLRVCDAFNNFDSLIAGFLRGALKVESPARGGAISETEANNTYILQE